MTVMFHAPDEFLEELLRDRTRIDRQILRITVRHRYGEPFTTVSVIASAIVEGSIVKLQQRIGENFMAEPTSEALNRKVQAALDHLIAAAKTLELDVRTGVYE